MHLTDVIGMGIAATGKFIATCNDKTELLIWSLKGAVCGSLKSGSSLRLNFNYWQVLAKLDTCHNLTYCSKVSPCGRFLYFCNELTSLTVVPLTLTKNYC